MIIQGGRLHLHHVGNILHGNALVAPGQEEFFSGFENMPLRLPVCCVMRLGLVVGMRCLHVPSLELIAAGDAAYNGVHPRLVESNQNQKRDEWLAAFNKMESLKPRTVVAGHKGMKNDDDGPRVIGQTRQYILDFHELVARTATAKRLYDQMLSRYPEWLNRGAPWSSATAIKK